MDYSASSVFSLPQFRWYQEDTINSFKKKKGQQSWKMLQKLCGQEKHRCLESRHYLIFLNLTSKSKLITVLFQVPVIQTNIYHGNGKA